MKYSFLEPWSELSDNLHYGAPVISLDFYLWFIVHVENGSVSGNWWYLVVNITVKIIKKNCRTSHIGFI
jgi:hypothetical protein